MNEITFAAGSRTVKKEKKGSNSPKNCERKHKKREKEEEEEEEANSNQGNIESQNLLQQLLWGERERK